MRRGMIGLVALAAVLLAALVMTPLGHGVGSFGATAQDASTPPATPPAAEPLQTQVAVLATEVALLGGVDLELIAGRLGGSRASFDASYGAPVGYVDAEGNVAPEPPLEGEAAQVVYEVTEVAQVTATFTNGRATQLTVTPLGTADQLAPEDVGWTLDEANQIGSRFSPADASAGTLISEQTEPAPDAEVTVQATSAALAALFPQPPAATVAADGCEPAAAASTETAAGTFTATLVFGPEELVSALTYAVGGSAPADGAAEVAAGSLAPVTPTPPELGRAGRGGSVNITSSLGGTTTANGIRVEAFQVRPDADGATAAAAEQVLTAVEIAITNTTDHNLNYDLVDFVLVGEEGAEVAAICGGVQPAITQGVLAPGESVTGWVTFQAPAGFVPERFVFLIDNGQIAFNLQ